MYSLEVKVESTESDSSNQGMEDQLNLNARVKKQGVRYFLGGALFGLLFPILATLIRILQSSIPFSFAQILEIHLSDPLIQIIDTAPFFLGLFAYFIGRAQAKAIGSQERRRKEAEVFSQQLREQNQDLQELNEVLDGLIYTASHDLKTPVVNLKSMLDMLRMIKDRPGSEAQMEQILDRMDLAADRFDHTIQDSFFSRV